MQSDPQSPWMFVLVIGLFSVFFPMIWCGVVLILSRVGGWSALASSLPDHHPPAHWNRTWASARFGAASYRSILKVAWSDRGLHLSVPGIFRPGHPPIFIPWSEIGTVEPAQVLFLKGVRFTVRGQTITFYGALAEDFEKARTAAG